LDSFGCDSIDIALYASPADASVTYQWDINGSQTLYGDSILATVELFDTAYEISVQLSVANTCGVVVVSQQIEIPAGFYADIIYDSEEIRCPGEIVDFINISNNVDSFIIDYGNGIISINEVLDTSFANNTDSTIFYDVVIYGYHPDCGWDTGAVVVPVRPAMVFASALYSDNAICVGEAVTFINNSRLQNQTIIYFGDGASTLIGNDDTISYSYMSAGIFYPTVVALGCGSDTNVLDPIEVFALPDFQIEITPGEPCIGEAVLLVNNGNTVSPTWTLGNDTLAQFTDTLYFFPDAAGTYVIGLHAVSEGNNFCTSTDSVSFTVGAQAGLTAVVDPVIGCAPLLVEVQLSSNSSQPDYLVDFGNQQIGTSGNVSTIYSDEGVFTIMAMVTNEDGCEADTSITVLVLEEYEVEAVGDTIVLIGDPVELDFTVNHPFVDFTWLANDELLGTNTMRPLQDFPLISTQYTIEVDGVEANCDDSDQLHVTVLCDKLFLPDAFTPNGDGVNDTYSIYKVFEEYNENTKISCIELIDWEIFDRWGERLFNTTTFDDAWDGSFRNDALNSGIYMLVVRFRNNLGKEEIIRKEIHLIN